MRGSLQKMNYPWGSETPVCQKGVENGAKFDDDSGCNDTDTEPVGSYSPNGYGLYDLAGNVWEWVDDWYSAYPGNTDSSSDYGTTYRVLRGGSWGSSVSYLRVSYRFGNLPVYNINRFGFRCSRSP